MAKAFERPGEKLSLIAAADHSEKRYYGVVVDSNGKAAIAGAAKRIAGVIKEGRIAGQVEEIIATGIPFVVYGAAVAAGKEVTTDANGKFVEADEGQPVAGIALVAGSADGDIGCILMTGGNVQLTKAAAIADAVAAADTAPTKAEFDAVVTKLNAVLAILRTDNIVSAS